MHSPPLTHTLLHTPHTPPPLLPHTSSFPKHSLSHTLPDSLSLSHSLSLPLPDSLSHSLSLFLSLTLPPAVALTHPPATSLPGTVLLTPKTLRPQNVPGWLFGIHWLPQLLPVFRSLSPRLQVFLIWIFYFYFDNSFLIFVLLFNIFFLSSLSFLWLFLILLSFLLLFLLLFLFLLLLLLLIYTFLFFSFTYFLFFKFSILLISQALVWLISVHQGDTF